MYLIKQEIESSKVQFLLFADDLVIVAENEEDIKRNAEVLNEVMAKWKMRINWQKTKVMVVQRGGGTCHLVVNDVEVEAVQTTKYLGAMFNDEASCDDEIENRIGTATRMVGALRRQVIERKELSKATKLRVTLQPSCMGVRLGLFRRDTEAKFRQWR